MAVWIPAKKALRRYGPIVGPFLLKKAQRELKPYWEAYQRAKRIDGFVGAFEDDDGKHWAVFGPDRQELVAVFPPLSSTRRSRAEASVDPSVLTHHGDTVLRKLEAAPGRIRDALPDRKRGGSGS